MSTDFPTDLDEFLSVADNPAMNASGRTATQVIGQIQAALAAVQAVIGVTDSAVEGTVEKRLADLLAALGAPVVVSATAPTDPAEGAIWLDTSAAPVLKVWVDGSPGAWASVSAPVSSVAGRTGAVVLSDADVPATAEDWDTTTKTAALTDRGKYIYATATGAKTVTFDTVAGGADGEYHYRNDAASGDVTLTASGVTLKAPKGGTLVLEPGDTATIKRVASNVLHVFGSTKAA